MIRKKRKLPVVEIGFPVIVSGTPLWAKMKVWAEDVVGPDPSVGQYEAYVEGWDFDRKSITLSKFYDDKKHVYSKKHMKWMYDKLVDMLKSTEGGTPLDEWISYAIMEKYQEMER